MMKAHTYKLKLVLIVAAALTITWFVAGRGRVAAQGKNELTPQEMRGKQIFLKGDGGQAGEITAFLGGDDNEMPAVAFTCANCHGLKGAGQDEGGLRPPSINWDALTRAHTSGLTRHQIAPYNEKTLARAISTGVDSNGERLHTGMPHYQMTDGQMADLIAYLKKMGTAADVDSGLSGETIKVGAALPMTGPLAKIGEDLKAAMTAVFADVNSQGGVYGRQINLVVEDSKGEPEETLRATRKLIEQESVFALVGSFEPGNSDATNQFLKRSEVPLVGPATLSPKVAVPPNPYIFYLLPTFGDQAHSLVDFAAAQAGTQKPRLAVVYANSEFDADALAGVRFQAKQRSIQIVAEDGFDAARFAPAAIADSLVVKKPDYIFFFGSAEQINAFAREMERVKLNASLLSSVVMIGRGAFNLPPSIAARTFLSFPAALPNQEGFSEFVNMMKNAKVELRNPAFQGLGFAAAKTFIEAMKLSNRQLSRPSFVVALEHLEDFNTGVVPPLTFGPNRRVGAVGSYIVGIDLTKKQYVPMSERIARDGQP
jgi:ABC-type branched-subunit amino acid transport system substrate-binding protein